MDEQLKMAKNALKDEQNQGFFSAINDKKQHHLEK
jgi:hypothetical protein